MSAGTAIAPGSRRSAGKIDDRIAVALDRGSRRRQHALAVVAAGQRLDDPRLALRQQPGEQQARLDLGAGDRHLVGDAVQGRAADLQRRQPVLTAPRSAPISRSGTAIRSTGRRRIDSSPSRVHSLPYLPRQPSRQQPQQGARVADVDRRASRLRADRRRGLHPQPRSLSARDVLPANPTEGKRPARTHGQTAPEPRARVERVSAASSRRLIVRLPLPHRRDQRRPVGDRLVRGRAQRSAQRSGGLEAGAAHAADLSRRRGVEDGDGVAEPAHQLRRLRRLLGAGDPEGDRAGGHVRRRVQRHVLDVDPGLAQRQGQLGDRPRPVGDDDPQLPQRPALGFGFEQAAAVRAGGGVPGGERLAVAARGSAPPPRAAAPRPSRPSRRPPRGCRRRCRPRSPGWSRRRGSRRGSSARRRAAARSPRSATRAASPARALATTCGRWLTVAIRRSWPPGSIACGRAPSAASARCRRS